MSGAEDTSKGDAALDAAMAAAYAAEPVERLLGAAPVRLLGVETSVRDASTRVLHGRASYELHGEIARGGIGVILRGRDAELGRDVALKVLREDLVHRPDALQRFVEEAQIGGQLQHPGIVPVYDLGLFDGSRPFFAMKLVEGRTLSELLASRQRPEHRKLLDVFEAVCQTIAYAHSRGVIHRDVKPANVLIGAFGEVQVVDWGLAKVLHAPERAEGGAAVETVRSGTASSHSLAGSVMGTPAYMPPEQARGEIAALDERADVFALGALLCEILTGAPPYEGDARVALALATNGELAPALQRLDACGADAELVALCKHCLAPSRSDRPSSAAAVAQRVEAYLSSVERRARDAQLRAAEARVRARTTIAFSAGAVVLVALAAGAWLRMKNAHANDLQAALNDARRQRGIAENEARDAGTINTFLIDLFAFADPGLARGRERTARDLLDEGARRLETQLEGQPLARAALLNSMGESYVSLGEWSRASELLERALALREEHAGPASAETAETLRSLALLELQLGKPSAVERASRSVEILRGLAEPPRELAASLVAYARALTSSGRRAEAATAFDEALALAPRVDVEQRALRAMVLGNLANLRNTNGEHAAALAAADEALETMRSLYGRLDPGITSASAARAHALARLGRTDEARAAYAELLELERELTGGESTRYASFLANSGNFESEAGDPERAIPALEDAAAIFARVAAPSDPNAANCRRMLGQAYVLAARWPDAAQIFDAEVSELADSGAPWSARAMTCHIYAALCREARGELDGAESVLATALERSDGATADDGSWKPIACALLAKLCAQRGDVAGAKAALARAEELGSIAKLSPSADSWFRFATGVVARAANDEQRAARELETFVDVARGPRNAEFVPVMARAQLAAVLADRDAPRALELARRARDELQSALGAEHPETRALDALLARLE